ncbi:MAG: hypothetical protein IPK82_43405 [Polyangiaceae bacterium]|nr:hypothetical protein [Polyangiaceae bacterium]
MRVRAFAFALVLTAAPAAVLSTNSLSTEPFVGVKSAEASVSVLLSLDELLTASSSVVVGTAVERKSQWEEFPTGKRIVTYTKIKVEKTITGSNSTEVWVRTLGGVVGELGQSVAGEAQIATGSKSVLFLMKRGETTVVAGMAQGHFPVVNDDKGTARLKLSPDAGTQLRPPGPVVIARDQLVGQTLETAVSTITKARKALDEKNK